MRWITRSHAHVDRVACPWLITRFIDSDTELLFVPKLEVEDVPKKRVRFLHQFEVDEALSARRRLEAAHGA